MTYQGERAPEGRLAPLLQALETGELSLFIGSEFGEGGWPWLRSAPSENPSLTSVDDHDLNLSQLLSLPASRILTTLRTTRILDTLSELGRAPTAHTSQFKDTGADARHPRVYFLQGQRQVPSTEILHVEDLSLREGQRVPFLHQATRHALNRVCLVVGYGPEDLEFLSQVNLYLRENVGIGRHLYVVSDRSDVIKAWRELAAEILKLSTGQFVRLLPSTPKNCPQTSGAKGGVILPQTFKKYLSQSLLGGLVRPQANVDELWTRESRKVELVLRGAGKRLVIIVLPNDSTTANFATSNILKAGGDEHTWTHLPLDSLPPGKPLLDSLKEWDKSTDLILTNLERWGSDLSRLGPALASRLNQLREVIVSPKAVILATERTYAYLNKYAPDLMDWASYRVWLLPAADELRDGSPSDETTELSWSQPDNTPVEQPIEPMRSLPASSLRQLRMAILPLISSRDELLIIASDADIPIHRINTSGSLEIILHNLLRLSNTAPQHYLRSLLIVLLEMYPASSLGAAIPTELRQQLKLP